MDYSNHYNLLIERARGRLLEEYTEKHHIIPRCINGTDDSNNIVKLTAQEHYVAHQLLIKIYPDEPKLIYAAKMMTINPIGKRSNNKLYGWLRQKHSVAMSETMKDNTNSKGKKKPTRSEAHRRAHSLAMTGKKKPVRSKEHRENLSKALRGKLKGPMSEENKQKISNALKGRIFTEEHKQKLREAKRKT